MASAANITRLIGAHLSAFAGIFSPSVMHTSDDPASKSAITQTATTSKCVAPAGMRKSRLGSNGGICTPALWALLSIALLKFTDRAEASVASPPSSSPRSRFRSPSCIRRCPRAWIVSPFSTPTITPVSFPISPRSAPCINSGPSARCNTPPAAPARPNSEAFSRDRANFGSVLNRFPLTPPCIRAKYPSFVL